MNTTEAGSYSEAQIRTFATDGYAILRGLVTPGECRFAATALAIAVTKGRLVQSDKQVEGSPAVYGSPFTESLLAKLGPRLEPLVGSPLLPTYSYARVYASGAILAKHRDRAACEISLSLCLEPDPAVPWPLYVETPSGEPVAANLGLGDALLYKGIERPHWREPFQGTRQIQTFLHYVRADGPHAGLKFDGRTGLELGVRSR